MSLWSCCICHCISIPVCYYRGKILCTLGNNTLNGKHSFLCWCLFLRFGFLVWLSHAKGIRDGKNVVYVEPCPKSMLESVDQGPPWRMAMTIHSCPAGWRDWCSQISVQRGLPQGAKYTQAHLRGAPCVVQMCLVSGWCCLQRPGTSFAMGCKGDK